LIQAAREGDVNALRRLLEWVDPAVRQWALAQTGDPDTAADLSQEVLVLMVRKLASYRGEARFLTWLYAITRNQALEMKRRHRRREEKRARWRAEAMPRSQNPNPAEEQVDRDRLKVLLDAFVSELPPRQREVFQMAELQGLTSVEIARVLDLEPVSVRGALLKARRSLRRKILAQHPEFAEEYFT
jgi:RNA polymerase sigma-70 factor (ECF subfamily)